MKFILPILFLLTSGSLWGQKHAFGIKAGVQFANFTSSPQGPDDGYLDIDGWVNTRINGGIFYRHQLTEKLYLEVAPNLFEERYSINYNGEKDNRKVTSSSRIFGLILYLPASLRLDLGKKLFFTIGGGPNFFLSKKIEDIVSVGRPVEEKEEIAYQESFDNLNLFPFNAEIGISYGFGRFNVNGKFVYRISEIFDAVNLSGKEYSLDLRTDYLQFEISYRLGKKDKN